MKTIYVHPGEILDIRVIHNKDELKNKSAWEYQLRPQRTFIKIEDDNYISFYEPNMRITQTDIITGNIIHFLR